MSETTEERDRRVWLDEAKRRRAAEERAHLDRGVRTQAELERRRVERTANTIESLTGVRPKVERELQPWERDGDYNDPLQPASFFLDLLQVSREARRTSGGPNVSGVLERVPWAEFDSGALAQMSRGGVEAARKRLGSVMQARATGDVTSSTEGGEFVPAAAPGFIATAFSTAARAASAVAPLFTKVPLARYATDGGGGRTITIPRLTTGATTAVTTEAGAVGTTEHVSASVQSLITTIAGNTVVSSQLFDHLHSADIVIAAELGEAYATKLDSELISGSNSAGRTTGLLNVASPTSGTYTAATSIAAVLNDKLLDLWRAAFVARGLASTHVILAPRTLAQLMAAGSNPPAVPYVESPNGIDLYLPYGPRIVLSNNLPLTLGAGTNETRAIFVYAPDLILATEGMQFQMADETLATSLQLVATAYGYAASGFKRAESVAILGGTGLA